MADGALWALSREMWFEVWLCDWSVPDSQVPAPLGARVLPDRSPGVPSPLSGPGTVVSALCP